MSAVEHTTLPAREPERRRLAVRRALGHLRIEGLDPDPIFAEYSDRYYIGEITMEEAIADYVRQVREARAAR